MPKTEAEAQLLAHAKVKEFKDKVKQGAPTALTNLEGWYNFAYEGGKFEVLLRPGGVFFSKEYMAPARWAVSDTTVLVDFGQYGQYEFTVTDLAARAMSGSYVGEPSNWRTMTYVRPLGAAEAMLLGAGGAGTEWDFEWSGGTFKIEFRGDGYNHFVCKDYPAHAHWTMGGAEEDELTIDWDKFGVYEIKLDAAGKCGAGCAKGQPDNWRKMTFSRHLSAVAVDDVPQH